MMTVTVLHFGPLRDARGVSAEVVQVPPGTSAGALLTRLHPALGGLPVALAVGQERVGPDHALRDGDEVAFLPPVGGG